MAKFLKSFFATNEKKPAKIETDDDKDFTPPLDDRRKLSISRSGRMKQNNKRRMKLNPELYGEDHQGDRCPSKEYHVHGKQFNTNNNNNEEIVENSQDNNKVTEVAKSTAIQDSTN